MKATIKDFKIIQNAQMDIKGVTVISGKNNNGKSSLFEAIRSACLGRRGDSYIRFGQKFTSVKLEFDNKSLVWERNKKDAIFYVGESEGTPKTGGFAPEEYSKELGIRNIEFPKFTLSPNFACQFEELFLIGASPIEAATSLSFLFSGEKFPELLKRISKSVKDDKEKLSVVEGAKLQLDEDVKSLTSQLSKFDKIKELFPLRAEIQVGIVNSNAHLNNINVLEDLMGSILHSSKEFSRVIFILENILKGVWEGDLVRIKSMSDSYFVWGDKLRDIYFAQKDVDLNNKELGLLGSIIPSGTDNLQTMAKALVEGANLESDIKVKHKLLADKLNVYNIFDKLDFDLVRLSNIKQKLTSGEGLNLGVKSSGLIWSEKELLLGRITAEYTSVLSEIGSCPYCGQGVDSVSKEHLLAHI